MKKYVVSIKTENAVQAVNDYIIMMLQLFSIIVLKLSRRAAQMNR